MTRRSLVLHKHRGESKLVTDLTTDKCFFSHQCIEKFHSIKRFRPALHSTQPPVGSFPRDTGRFIKLTVPLHIASRLRMPGDTLTSPPIHLLKLYRENFNFNRTEGLTKLQNMCLEIYNNLILFQTLNIRSSKIVFLKGFKIETFHVGFTEVLCLDYE